MHIVELINGLIASLHASRYRIEKIDIVESLRVRMPSRCRDLIQRTAFLRWVECNIAMLTQSSNRKQILCRKLHRFKYSYLKIA